MSPPIRCGLLLGAVATLALVLNVFPEPRPGGLTYREVVTLICSLLAGASSLANGFAAFAIED